MSQPCSLQCKDKELQDHEVVDRSICQSLRQNRDSDSSPSQIHTAASESDGRLTGLPESQRKKSPFPEPPQQEQQVQQVQLQQQQQPQENEQLQQQQQGASLLAQALSDSCSGPRNTGHGTATNTALDTAADTDTTTTSETEATTSSSSGSASSFSNSISAEAELASASASSWRVTGALSLSLSQSMLPSESVSTTVAVPALGVEAEHGHEPSDAQETTTKTTAAIEIAIDPHQQLQPSRKKIIRWKDLHPVTSNVPNDSLDSSNHAIGNVKTIECRMERINLNDSLRKSYDIAIHPDRDDNNNSNSNNDCASSCRPQPTEPQAHTTSPSETMYSNNTTGKPFENYNNSTGTNDHNTTKTQASSATHKHQPAHQSKSNQLLRMELDIKKAARQEIHYLTSVEELREKRYLLKQACDSLLNSIRRGSLSKSTEDILQLELAKVQAEMEKAAAMERKYTQKVKNIFEKRHRWTQLYELMQNDDSNSTTTTSVDEDHCTTTYRKLPPLLALESTSTRKVASTSTTLSPHSTQPNCT